MNQKKQRVLQTLQKPLQRREKHHLFINKKNQATALWLFLTVFSGQKTFTSFGCEDTLGREYEKFTYQ